MLDNVASLKYFMPETILSLGILGILLVDVVYGKPSRMRASAIALGTLLLAAVSTIATMNGAAFGLFGGLIAHDPFTDFFKLFFIATTAFVCMTATRSRDAIEYQPGENQDRESGEFFALVLSTTVGMCLMAAATDLLIAFISLEFVSILSYILAGFKRRNRQSSEAALKYVVYGGVASGVMLYGMSLLYGLAGSTSFTDVLVAVHNTHATLTVIAAVTLCLAGFGYKIASVPFHMWCPDVYEGAPTAVTAFLSVGPKAAGFALLIRFFSGAVPMEIHTELGHSPWPILLGCVAAASMTLGNLAAVVQQNLKRMLAYSSIAQAGYLLLGLCAGSSDGTRAILIYLVTYLFMNLGAFIVVIAMSDAGVGETMSDYRGLAARAPFPAAIMAICLFSLTGLPPFAGFFGKFYLFASVLKVGGLWMTTLALIGVLNSAVSLYYYARILKAMYFEKGESEEKLTTARVHLVNMGLMGVATVGMWLLWSPLVRFVSDSLLQWYPHMQPALATVLP